MYNISAKVVCGYLYYFTLNLKMLFRKPNKTAYINMERIKEWSNFRKKTPILGVLTDCGEPGMIWEHGSLIIDMLIL